MTTEYILSARASRHLIRFIDRTLRERLHGGKAGAIDRLQRAAESAADTDSVDLGVAMYDPAAYEAWYRTRRGAWVAEREFALMIRLLRPSAPATLLDVGAGTGHFSRAFAAAGLEVTALDPAAAMLRYASALGGARASVAGMAQRLPFADRAFDYGAAVTSFCFVPDPERALAELWRVSRRGVILGLLNRCSLLYRQKAGRGGYAGARWDTPGAVRRWAHSLAAVDGWRIGSAIFFPGGGLLSRTMEHVLPTRLPWGGFLAICLIKRNKFHGDRYGAPN